MRPKISILIPTCGRETLDRAINSALAAMGTHDELLVIGDGPSQIARRITSTYSDYRLRYLETPPTHKWGCFQYDFGSMVATGEFLMFFTDDDVLVPRATDIVREGVRGKKWPHIFAMDHRPQKRILRNSIRRCEVGAHQIVVPNDPKMLARWTADLSETNDHAYLMATLDKYKCQPEFHPEVIAVMLVHNMGKRT